MRRNTIVICAFPGTGKTALFNSNEKEATNSDASNVPIILDSDSSKFSWIEPGVRNPDFPNNYISHIKENIGKADIILTSTHKVVRDALKEADITFIIVYPFKNLKGEYINRYINRNSPESFIKLMDEKWDEFISELDEIGDLPKIKMGSGGFLSNIFEDKSYETKHFLDIFVN